MNYFQIHKNKKPKTLIKNTKYIDPTPVIVSLVSAMSAMKIASINAQIGLDEIAKRTEIFLGVTSAQITIVKILKNQKQLRFKATGRYIK